MTQCKHADSGCNYPEGECLGVCMSKSQHTPGPWVAMPKPAPSHSDHGWRAIAMCGSRQMVAVRYSQVCKVESNVVVATSWDHEANARLIAAAPELLDALKLAQQIIGHPDDEASKVIAAAISKATTQKGAQ